MQKGGDKANEGDEYQEAGAGGMVLPAHVAIFAVTVTCLSSQDPGATCSPLDIRFLLCSLYCVIPAPQP